MERDAQNLWRCGHDWCITQIARARSQWINSIMSVISLVFNGYYLEACWHKYSAAILSQSIQAKALLL